MGTVLHYIFFVWVFGFLLRRLDENELFGGVDKRSMRIEGTDGGAHSY